MKSDLRIFILTCETVIECNAWLYFPTELNVWSINTRVQRSTDETLIYQLYSLKVKVLFLFWEIAFDLITYKHLKTWHDKAKLISTLNYAFVALLEMLWSNYSN